MDQARSFSMHNIYLNLQHFSQLQAAAQKTSREWEKGANWAEGRGLDNSEWRDQRQLPKGANNLQL